MAASGLGNALSTSAASAGRIPSKWAAMPPRSSCRCSLMCSASSRGDMDYLPSVNQLGCTTASYSSRATVTTDKDDKLGYSDEVRAHGLGSGAFSTPLLGTHWACA